jgi:hypothetical protein
VTTEKLFLYVFTFGSNALFSFIAFEGFVPHGFLDIFVSKAYFCKAGREPINFIYVYRLALSRAFTSFGCAV